MKGESKFCKFHPSEFNDEDWLYPKLLSPRQMYCGYQMLKRQIKKMLQLNEVLQLSVNKNRTTEVTKIHAKLVQST